MNLFRLFDHAKSRTHLTTGALTYHQFTSKLSGDEVEDPHGSTRQTTAKHNSKRPSKIMNSLKSATTTKPANPRQVGRQQERPPEDGEGHEQIDEAIGEKTKEANK